MARLTANSLQTGHRGFSVTDVTFTLRGGDVFGLLGRSGSGKSTILNTLIGSLTPQAGQFSAEGIIGYSPQKNALYPFLTIKENLEVFGELYDVPRAELEQRITQLLDRLDLAPHAHKRITEVSGGMEKRVDLAVTLVHDPDIIILDEPFNGLDISLQKFIWELLRELAKKGKLIIITSHLLADVQKYCTTFGLVENNRFYGDTELRNAVQRQSGSLEAFLEQLFRRDLRMEKK